ncbi:MAG TPA: MerR family transcriptional regulator [Acidimicrobiales bacterium]|nr:MerR family transcriptional regulator [Acidimicrobiales bacterium]
MELARIVRRRADPGATIGSDAVSGRRSTDAGPIDVSEEVSDVWVTVGTAAEKSGVSTGTIRQWYRSGRLPTQRSEGERGVFLVPIEDVLRLARLVEETGDMGDDAILDLDADYWSAATEAARADAAEARHFAAAAREDADAASARADAAEHERDELAERVEAVEQERDAARAEAESSSGALAEAEARQRRLTARLDDMARRLATAEESALGAAARANEAEGLLEQAAPHTEFLRQQLEEANAELRTLRSRIVQLEEDLRVARSFASVTDHSWLDAGVPGYKGPVREQGGRDTPPEETLLASDDRSTRRPQFPGPLTGAAADAGAEAGDDDVPEPFAVDEFENDRAPEPRPAPPVNPGARRRRPEFDFGSAADDLLPEEPPKHRRR